MPWVTQNSIRAILERSTGFWALLPVENGVEVGVIIEHSVAAVIASIECSLCCNLGTRSAYIWDHRSATSQF